MFDAVNVIGLYAETPVHPGSGATRGAVDLPIQRETHTGIPPIPAPSFKGVLRDEAEQKSRREKAEGRSGFDDKIAEVFGPTKGDDHGGALSPTDARLLLFPVRSLEGIFVWVTCPMVIQRFVRDLAVCDQALATLLNELNTLPVGDSKALVPTVNGGNPLTDPLVLEEYEYTKAGTVPPILISAIQHLMPDTAGYKGYQSRLSTYLAVISNTDFRHVVTTSTEIVTRIKLNERKTTTGGGGNMWTEEFLPSDCLFYSLLLAMPSRKKGGTLTTGQMVLDFVRTTVEPKMIQIGGDETVGRGWMRVHFVDHDKLQKAISPNSSGGTHES